MLFLDNDNIPETQLTMGRRKTSVLPQQLMYSLHENVVNMENVYRRNNLRLHLSLKKGNSTLISFILRNSLLVKDQFSLT